MAPPLPNAGLTEATPRPRKPLCFRQEVGEGFITGSVLGSAYHFAKGGFQAVCKKAPCVGAYVAVFSGASSAIEYAMVSARRKEEPVLNSAVAAAGATAIVTMPKGVRLAAETALLCGAFIGALRAGQLKIQEDRRRKLSPQQQADDPAPAACPT